MQANVALDTTQAQVSSGKVSTDYAGIGDKTAALEAARAAAARADAYATNTQLAVTQTDLQDTQLTTLSSLAEQLKHGDHHRGGQFRRHQSDGDGAEHLRAGVGDPQFDRCQRQLHLWRRAGTTPSRSPRPRCPISQAGTVSSFFQNGTQKKSVLVGDGQSVQIGVLASDIGTQLMTALQDLPLADSPSGSLDGSVDQHPDRRSDQQRPAFRDNGRTGLNTATAANGDTYNQPQGRDHQPAIAVHALQGLRLRHRGRGHGRRRSPSSTRTRSRCRRLWR
jgi:flagellar hook-associated protein 3 FlgL